MDWNRRTILKAGAAAAATAAVPRVFAQQAGQRGTGKFYERGPVRIYYEEAGSGFPLLLIPGGGLNSTIAFFSGNAPLNAMRNSRESIAASPRTSATPPTGSPPVRSRSAAPGNPMLTTNSA